MKRKLALGIVVCMLVSALSSCRGKQLSDVSSEVEMPLESSAMPESTGTTDTMDWEETTVSTTATVPANSNDPPNSSNASAVSSTVSSQTVQNKEFIRQILFADGNPEHQWYMDAGATADGGFAAVGYEQDGTARQGVLDFFDAYGNRVIQKRFNGCEFYHMAVSQNGNSMIAKSYGSNCNDLMCVDSSGETVWMQHYDMPGTINCLAVDAEGRTAFVEWNSFDYSSVLWEISSDGSVLQKKKLINKTAGSDFDIAAKREGGFILSGTCSDGSSAALSEAAIVEACNKGNSDGFIASYSNDLQLQWVRSFGGTGNDYGDSVAVGEDGAVYATFYGTMPDGDFAGVLKEGDSSARVLVKWNGNGEKQYTAAVTGNGLAVQGRTLIYAKPNGSVLISGQTINNSQKKEKLLSVYPADYGKSDTPEEVFNYILSLDATGKTTNGYIFAGEATAGYPNSVIRLKSGKIVIAGGLNKNISAFSDGNTYSYASKSICVYNGPLCG